MTEIYITMALMIIAIIVFIVYFSSRLSDLEGLSTSTARVVMDIMNDTGDMRLIDANKLKSELHRLLVYGVLKEDDLRLVTDCVDQAPTVFEFKRHDDAETESDNI